MMINIAEFLYKDVCLVFSTGETQKDDEDLYAETVYGKIVEYNDEFVLFDVDLSNLKNEIKPKNGKMLIGKDFIKSIKLI